MLFESKTVPNRYTTTIGNRTIEQQLQRFAPSLETVEKDRTCMNNNEMKQFYFRLTFHGIALNNLCIQEVLEMNAAAANYQSRNKQRVTYYICPNCLINCTKRSTGSNCAMLS